MTSQTTIKWATHVLNDFTGCDQVSSGCDFCYAKDVAEANQRKELGRRRVAEEQGKPLPMFRYQNDGNPETSGPGFGFTVHWDKLRKRGHFPAGSRVFVNSMSDVFHEKAPTSAIAMLWAKFAIHPQANFLVLTKRAPRMRRLLNDWHFWDAVKVAISDLGDDPDAYELGAESPPANVWVGVTIEKRGLIRRADMLRATPAAVRWISAEPLLGPLIPDAEPAWSAEWGSRPARWSDRNVFPGLDLTDIDWVVAGGESGAHFNDYARYESRFLVDADGRPRSDRMRWIRDLQRACEATGTAFFFKQIGGRRPDGEALLDGVTYREYPRQMIGARA